MTADGPAGLSTASPHATAGDRIALDLVRDVGANRDPLRSPGAFAEAIDGAR